MVFVYEVPVGGLTAVIVRIISALCLSLFLFCFGFASPVRAACVIGGNNVRCDTCAEMNGLQVKNLLKHPGSNNNSCRVVNLEQNQTIRVVISDTKKQVVGTNPAEQPGDQVQLGYSINITPFTATPANAIMPTTFDVEKFFDVDATDWDDTQQFTKTGATTEDTTVSVTVRRTNPANPEPIEGQVTCYCDGGGTPTPKAKIEVRKTTIVPDAVEPLVGDNTFTLVLTPTSGTPVQVPITVNGEAVSPLTDVTVDPGDYVFSEILPPNPQDIPSGSHWEQTQLQCSIIHNASGNNSNPDSDTKVQQGTNIKIAENDVIRCTATNTLVVEDEPDEKGKIIIKKEATGVTEDVTFDFEWITSNGLSDPLDPTFSSDGTKIVVPATGFNVEPDTYVIEEKVGALPPGWQLVDIVCVEEGGDNLKTGNVSVGEGRATIKLDAGETVVCTFYNRKGTGPDEDVVKKFIKRRVDNLLSHDPDRSRIQRRLDQQRPGSMKDSHEPMKLSGNFTNGSFSDFKEVNMKFSTSLAQLRAAAFAEEVQKLRLGAEDGLDLGFRSETHVASLFLKPQRFDIWVEGQYSHYKDTQGGFTSDGDFGILYLGADYAINEWLLVGALVQFDWTREDINGADLFGKIEGDGWMVGPYVGMKISDRIYFNARAAWGQSDNDMVLTDSVFGTRYGSFKTERWLASAELTGNWTYNRLTIAPSVKLSYGNENQDQFLNSVNTLIAGSDVTIGRLTFGPEFSTTIERADGTIIQPHLVIQGIWNFDQEDILLSNGEVLKYEELRGKIEGGVIVRLTNGHSLRLTGHYDGIGDGDLDSYGAQFWFNVPLN